MLTEAANVLDRTIDNGGLREEASVVMTDGSINRSPPGEEAPIGQTASTKLYFPAGSEPGDVAATIHSHPIKAREKDGGVYSSSALNPSDADRENFSSYNTNIIIGRLGYTTYQPTAGGNQSLSTPGLGAAIYDRTGNPKTAIVLTQSALNKIISHYGNN